MERLILESGAARVCDIGAGANPALPVETIERLGLDYVMVDASREELDKAPPQLHKVVASVYDLPADLRDFDVVVSLRVAEHVSDPARFHRVCRGLLSLGGVAFHHFPTLYSPPFLLNRLMPEALSNRMLMRLDPNRAPEGSHAKFEAFYRWCRGPMKSQIRRLESTGFAVEEYEAAFGTSYLQRFPRLQRFNDSVARTLVKHPVPALTSFAWVVLRAVPEVRTVQS